MDEEDLISSDGESMPEDDADKSGRGREPGRYSSQNKSSTSSTNTQRKDAAKLKSYSGKGEAVPMLDHAQSSICSLTPPPPAWI
jgi:hypothetical protein